MASNLVLRRPLLRDTALAIAGGSTAGDTDSLVRRRSRNFFVVPWRGGTLIGTDYRPWPAAQRPRLDREALDDFVRQVNETRAFDPIDAREVVRVHSALLPAVEGQAAPAKRTTIAVQGRFLRVQAVKYTTAPEVADAVVRVLLDGGTPPPDEPLPTPPAAEESLDQTVRRAVHDEMAMRLSDVVARRTNWADFGPPDAAHLGRAADVMATLLDWSDTRRSGELEEVHRLLAVP
jgi:glycerol-3-phosphate dehydrogenase